MINLVASKQMINLILAVQFHQQHGFYVIVSDFLALPLYKGQVPENLWKQSVLYLFIVNCTNSFSEWAASQNDDRDIPRGLGKVIFYYRPIYSNWWHNISQNTKLLLLLYLLLLNIVVDRFKYHRLCLHYFSIEMEVTSGKSIKFTNRSVSSGKYEYARSKGLCKTEKISQKDVNISIESHFVGVHCLYELPRKE